MLNVKDVYSVDDAYFELYKSVLEQAALDYVHAACFLHNNSNPHKTALDKCVNDLKECSSVLGDIAVNKINILLEEFDFNEREYRKATRSVQIPE